MQQMKNYITCMLHVILLDWLNEEGHVLTIGDAWTVNKRDPWET